MNNLQEASDLENTVQVSARRFEESPHIERTNSEKMFRGVYAGRGDHIDIRQHASKCKQ